MEGRCKRTRGELAQLPSDQCAHLLSHACDIRDIFAFRAMNEDMKSLVDEKHVVRDWLLRELGIPLARAAELDEFVPRFLSNFGSLYYTDIFENGFGFATEVWWQRDDLDHPIFALVVGNHPTMRFDMGRPLDDRVQCALYQAFGAHAIKSPPVESWEHDLLMERMPRPSAHEYWLTPAAVNDNCFRFVRLVWVLEHFLGPLPRSDEALCFTHRCRFDVLAFTLAVKEAICEEDLPSMDRYWYDEGLHHVEDLYTALFVELHNGDVKFSDF